MIKAKIINEIIENLPKNRLLCNYIYGDISFSIKTNQNITDMVCIGYDFECFNFYLFNHNIIYCLDEIKEYDEKVLTAISDMLKKTNDEIKNTLKYMMGEWNKWNALY